MGLKYINSYIGGLIMKTFIIVVTILTALLFFSTLVCGLWIKANDVTEISSIKFHMTVGISSFVMFAVMVIAVLIKIK